MPEYTFRDDKSGRTFNVSMTREEFGQLLAGGGKRTEKSRLTGRTITSTAVVIRDNSYHAIPSPSNWPMVSDAMSTNPSQAAEFNEAVKAAGILGVHYDANGDCHLSSPGARKAWAQHRGLRDRNGGYSDP
jgi:hypothetical protein